MIPCFLAGAFRIGEENAIRALIPSGSTVSQVIIYAGALVLVALAVFAWVFVSRRKRHRRHSSHRRHKSEARQTRQPENLRHYGTLAETGGLPPIRTGQQRPSQE